MQPNKTAIRQHLEFLFSGMEDYKDGRFEISILNDSENFIFGSIDEAVEKAVHWNEQGKNVYTVGSIMSPNTAPFGRNSDSDFYATNVLWCDIDDPVNPNDLKEAYKDCPPSLVVVTGRTPYTRTHLWWKLDDALTDSNILRRAVQGIQLALGGDPAAKNPTRLMRLGGSVAWPKKEGRVAEVTEVIIPSNAKTTTLERIMEVYPLPEQKAKPLISQDNFKSTGLHLQDNKWLESDIKEILSHISPDVGYHDWCQIGMAIHSEGMSFATWDDWSSRGSTYKPEEMAKKWASFKGSGVSIGTLIHLAKEHGWQPKTYSAPPEVVQIKKQETTYDPQTGEVIEPKADTKQDELKPYSWIEADDITPVIDVADFVEGTLRDNEMSVIYGKPNCGKTFFMVDLSLHIALGREWNGREIEQGLVVYVSMEGASGIKNRIIAFKQFYKVKDHIPMVVIPKAFSMMNAGDAANFLKTLYLIEEQHGRVRMIVIDTLARAMAGGDENSTKDMSVFVANCDAIREHTQAHMAVIHHSGKDDTRGARGSTALLGGIDTEIELTRDKDSKIVTVKVTKQREMEASDDLFYQLETVPLGPDRREKMVTSCVVLPVNSDNIEKKKKVFKVTARQQTVLNAIHNTMAKYAKERHVLSDMPITSCITREELNSELRVKGFYEGTTRNTQGTRLRDALEALEIKGLAFSTEALVWTIKK